MAQPVIDISDLVANPLAQIRMAGFGGAPVVAYHSVEFSSGASNEYNNPFESEAQEKLSAIANRVLPAASGVVNYFTGKESVPSAQFSLKSFNQTIDSWTKSSKPSFPIKVYFIALRPTDDVRVNMKKVMRGVMPNKGTLSQGLGLNVITAPLGFGPQVVIGQSNNNANTTVSLSVPGTLVVSIGTWFKGRGLVLKDAKFTFSKQVIRSGNPLWCEMDLTFNPYRQLSNDEFASFFP
jgi:hypothetical protein